MKKVLFIDRDGTIIEDVGYLRDLSQVDLLPWAGDAIQQLNDAGFAVVVITNQSGVARGYFDEAHVQATHRALDAALAPHGARIESYYYCPHYPQSSDPRYGRECDCRKPARGLVDRAARELGVDPRRSFVVGDRWLDLRLARAVGARGVLVRTGYGRTEEARPVPDVAADAVADNLMGATSWILRNLQP
jgi:D-glycero-D-manno-heptose 1,7-bisphosphate phosphatase